MLISTNIPTLLNGVSQQPPTQRFPSQAQEQINGYSSVIEGLGKRPSSEFIAKLSTIAYTSQNDVLVHGINRDATERYIVMIHGPSATPVINIYGLDGSVKTVNTPDGVSYLQIADRSRQIKCVTIGDYTFVLNKSKVVAMSATLTATRNPEALFVVENGAYDTKYKISIGASSYTHTTGNTAGDADCITIATALLALIAASPPTGVTVTREGYVLHAQSTTATDFTATVSDGLGGDGLKLMKGSVQSFVDLPSIAQHNMFFKIDGIPGSPEDDYYVGFIAKNAGFGEGNWVEVVAPGVKSNLDPATMPYVLIRLSDGTFVFKKADGVQYSSYAGTDAGWALRTTGDTVTNPDPSFVGQKINDIFLFKDRLGFLANESVIMSETAEYFSFFRTTVTQIIDTDPIDIQSGFAQVSVLRSAVPLNDRLVVFSDKCQFIVQGGQVFTPTQVSMTPATRYEMTTDFSPIATGNSVFFPISRSGNVGLREFTQSEQDASIFDAQEITAAVPKYLPISCRAAVFNSMESALVLLPDVGGTELYIYKFYGTGTQRIQSSWSKFTTPGQYPLGIAQFDNYLYILYYNAGNFFIYLERMDFSPNQRDQLKSGTTYALYKTLLDSRVIETQCTVTYNSGTDQTTVVFPFAYRGVSHNIQIVSRAAAVGGGFTNYGEVFYDGVMPSNNTVVVSGKLETTAGTVAFYAGYKYEMLYEFSELSLKATRSQAQGAASVALTTGRLQVRYCTVTYANSGFFSSMVLPEYGDSSLVEWTGNDLGLNNATLGQMNISDGKFQFAVYQKSDEVRIQLRNSSFLPSFFLSAEFECIYNTRSKRV